LIGLGPDAELLDRRIACPNALAVIWRLSLCWQ
jgi:hypothetical protein